MLGLENGDRPPLDFPGYWLYSGGVAAVHLMGTRKPGDGIVVRGTEKKYEDTGRLDHIGFAASDVEGVRRRLQSRGVKFRESIVPRTGDTQFFLYDPDGVGVRAELPEGVTPRPTNASVRSANGRPSPFVLEARTFNFAKFHRELTATAGAPDLRPDCAPKNTVANVVHGFHVQRP